MPWNTSENKILKLNIPIFKWKQTNKLLASDGAESDFFGYSVDIDKNTMVIGARGDDDFGETSGSADVFTKAGGTWTEQSKLMSKNGVGGDLFGYAVAIQGDNVVVGSKSSDDKGTDSGTTYVFDYVLE